MKAMNLILFSLTLSIGVTHAAAPTNSSITCPSAAVTNDKTVGYLVFDHLSTHCPSHLGDYRDVVINGVPNEFFPECEPNNGLILKEKIILKAGSNAIDYNLMVSNKNTYRYRSYVEACGSRVQVGGFEIDAVTPGVDSANETGRMALFDLNIAVKE